MYKITWDKETGGVLLHSRIVEGTFVKQGTGSLQFTSVPVSLVCVSHAFSESTGDLKNGIPQGLNKKIESNETFSSHIFPSFYFYKFACKILNMGTFPIHKTKTVHQS